MTIEALYRILYTHFGPQNWWPSISGTRFEVIAGAVLTQNTSWNNVEKAIANLLEAGALTPEKILASSDAQLQEWIRPAGFFTRKCGYLKEMAQFFLLHEEEYIQSPDVWELRERLLALRGIGAETADSILLYGFNKPIFVIDAYTRRIAERHLELDGKMPYDALQKIFMDSLPRDAQLYNEYHALILALAKSSCKKSQCGELCRKLLKGC